MKGSIATALLVLGASAGWDAPRADGSITYKYRENDGTVWFTDRKPQPDRLDDFEFLGYHGRPPAHSSCRGLGQGELAQRARRIATPMEQWSNHFEVDARLIKAMIAVESCFDPRAVSRVGARGLMQLMPATAESLGIEDAFDITQNLRGGVEFFSRMWARYEGNTVLALAAYNAGPGAVDRHEGIPPYPETEQYVRRVLERWQAYREPDQSPAN